MVGTHGVIGDRVGSQNLRAVVLCPAREVVQRDDAGYQVRKPRRDRRVGHVGVVGLAVYHDRLHPGLEGLLDLGDVAGKIYPGAATGDLVHGEAVPLEPVADGCDILGGGPEPATILLGSDPLVVVRRRRVMEPLDETVEGLGFGCRNFQRQDHPFHWERGVGGTGLVAGARQGMGVPPQNHRIVVVDESSRAG